jgi:polysaccharide biosynthesis protein PslE
MNNIPSSDSIQSHGGMGSHGHAGVTLREILTLFFRDYRRIGGVFLVGLLATLVVASLPTPKYTSEAALLLRLGREYVYTPEIGEPQSGSPMAYDREQTLLAETRILTSRDIKESVLDKIGVATVYPHLSSTDNKRSRDMAVLAMERALEAELLKGSNLMQVSFTHTNPEIAAKVLSALIDAYLQKRSVIFASASYGTAEADFVTRTVQLNAAEAKLSALKKERGIRAFAEEQSLLLAQRNALELKQSEISLALAQSNGRARALQGSLRDVSPDVVLTSETMRSDALEAARKTLLDLNLKERDLSSKYVDNHPMVIDVRTDIQRTKDFIRELEANPPRAVRSGRSPVKDLTESELVKSQADRQQSQSGVASLSGQRASVEARLQAFAASERELRALEIERRLAEVNYEAAAKRLRDEMVLEDLDRKRKSNVSIVQPPLLPLTAKSVRAQILAVGFFISLCAALLTAFLSALWRGTYITPEEVERSLGIPLLVAVPDGAA